VGLLVLVIWGGLMYPRERYWIALLLMFVAILGYFIWQAYAAWADRLFPEVAVVRGRMSRFRGPSAIVGVTVGGKTFDMNAKRAEGFTGPGLYTVYYLKRSRTAISATKSSAP
jgi:hypothetical protein